MGLWEYLFQHLPRLHDKLQFQLSSIVWKYLVVSPGFCNSHMVLK